MFRFALFLISVVGVLSIPPPPRPHLNSNVTVPGTGKIINGIDAQPGQFPYIVSLNYVGDGHSCGASILTTNWVLTAAHCCLTGAAEYVYTSSIYLSSGGLSFDIAETRVHPEYDPDNYWHNDICLVRINGNIPLDGNAQQVTLINSDFVVPDGSPIVIPGWGYTTANEPQNVPDRLQVVTQYNALSAENCAGRTGVPQFPGHICGQGSGGQGVCQGDSGGPLTFQGAQVGITSFVFLPCASGWPDYFTRVANYIPWILQNVGADAHLIKFADF